jgi:hypothetical protein
MGKTNKRNWDDDETQTKEQLRRDQDRRKNKRLKADLKTKNIDSLINIEDY